MHQAYEAKPILERLPLEIESITAYESNLVVGTRQGHLLMYHIGDAGTQGDMQLLRSNKNFSRKPITQVAVVPHHQILLSLSDNIVSVHDLTVYNFPLLSTITSTKGAAAFDLELRHHVSLTGETVVTVRLAVAVRRKVQLYYWKARHFHSLEEEFSLTDPPTQLAWCGGGTIVVDQTTGYSRLKVCGGGGSANLSKHINSTTTKSRPGTPASDPDTAVIPYGRGCEPQILHVGSDRVALLVNSSGGGSNSGLSLVLLDESGEAQPPQQLAFTSTPTTLVYEAPFVVGVVGRVVEVVAAAEAVLLQTISVNKPRMLAANLARKGGEQPRVFCASVSHVWCLTGVATRQQIPALLQHNHFSLALQLLDKWGGMGDGPVDEDVHSSREHIHKLHAFHLFCQHDFQAALGIFLDIDTDLLFVIGLFPQLVPEDCQRRLQYPTPPPALSPHRLRSALNCLIDYLLKKRQRLVHALERRGSSRPGSGSKKGELQVVDTTLLKCYLEVSPALVGPLLRMPDGRVSLAESERLLRERGRLPDLLLLLRARGNHTRALTLLHQHQHTREHSPLRGPRAMVDYLQHLGVDQLEMVLQHSVWLVKQHPLEALEVFTGHGAPVSDAENFPRYKVLAFIMTHQPRLAVLYLEHLILEWGDASPALHNDLIKLYKNIIVNETKRLKHATSQQQQTEECVFPADNNSDGAQVNSLEGIAGNNLTSNSVPRDTGKSTNTSTAGSNNSSITRTSTSSTSVPNSNSTTSTFYIPTSTATTTAISPPALKEEHVDLQFPLTSIRQKFLSFLRSSQHYTPATVLLSLADDECLWSGRAAVLGRLGQHRQALQLYVTALQDLPEALHYCRQHYAPTGAASQVYLILLELLIQCQDVVALVAPRSRDLSVPTTFTATTAAATTAASRRSTPVPGDTSSPLHHPATTNTPPPQADTRIASPTLLHNQATSPLTSPTDRTISPSSSCSSRMGADVNDSRALTGGLMASSKAQNNTKSTSSFNRSDNDNEIHSNLTSNTTLSSSITTSYNTSTHVSSTNTVQQSSADTSRVSWSDSSARSAGSPGGGRSDEDEVELQHDKFDMLLKLLAAYTNYIHLKPAVQLLPGRLAVRELRGFLQSWLRSLSSRRRRSTLQHGAATAVQCQVKSDLCSAQTNKVMLSTQRCCCFCKKRLTKFSAFVVYPRTGAVCHFSCRERQHNEWLHQLAEARARQQTHERTRAALVAGGGGGGGGSGGGGGGGGDGVSGGS